MLNRATTSAALLAAVFLMPVHAQEKSVRPGVNDTFRDPDPKAFTERFETESREVLQSGFIKTHEVRDLLKENYMVVFEPAEEKQAAVEDPAPAGRGRGRGMGAGRGPGGGRGMGPDAAMRVDQDVFHYLLDRHQLIRREVKNLDQGVETITESDDAAVAGKIQEHVAAMHERVKSGRGLRFWDELFVAVFKNYDKVTMGR